MINRACVDTGGVVARCVLPAHSWYSRNPDRVANRMRLAGLLCPDSDSNITYLICFVNSRIHGGYWRIIQQEFPDFLQPPHQRLYIDPVHVLESPRPGDVQRVPVVPVVIGAKRNALLIRRLL